MELCVGLDMYDRHLPFFLGLLKPNDGVKINALQVGMAPPRKHGTNRHSRMFHEGEFDACEVSFVSFLMARERGLPFVALPIFPRRLFTSHQVFVRSDSAYTSPRDLMGKKVLIWAYQVTMSVLAKADFQRDYGVSFRDIHWVTQHAEEIPWTPPVDIRVDQAPKDSNEIDLLISGEVDAYINPHPPLRILDDPRVRRLSLNPEEDSENYIRQHGYYPIMHLIAVKKQLAESHAHLLPEIMRLWEDSKRIANDFYTDASFSIVQSARVQYEEQKRIRPDLWPSGIEANRANLDWFLGACHEQGLVQKKYLPEDIFHSSMADT